YARTRYLAIPRSALPASIGATLFPSLDTITPSRPLGRMIHSHFQGIFDLAWNPAPTTTDPADLVARQLLELLAVFCATGETETATDPISGIGAARYADVLNLMTWHCAEPGLAPEQIADRAGLSRSSLYRLFRARGTHFSRELLRIRLERARTLLGAVDERPSGITEVAIRCGFATPSVFSRQFHAAFDMTPSEYRRSLMRRN
ncbi:MAG: helix-turn-helix transcriptional regulator, partial [Gammaproteobacteria bacterium]